MRTVLPGKPQAKLQALCTAQWEGLRLVVSNGHQDLTGEHPANTLTPSRYTYLAALLLSSAALTISFRRYILTNDLCWLL